MTSQTSLRLDKITLKNYRCFSEITLDLASELTVLVAENGKGKTALLDAIGLAFGPWVDILAGTGFIHRFSLNDVHLSRGQDGKMEPVLPTSFEAHGYVRDANIQWGRVLKSYTQRAKASIRDTADLISTAQSYVDNLEPTSHLPLLAFYGTGRLWSEHKLTYNKKLQAISPNHRFSGYVDSLSSSSSFKGMVSWYERRWAETKDPRFSRDLTKNINLLKGVQQAVEIVLQPTGWSEIDWDADSATIHVRNSEHGAFPLNSLSDGVRNMIALVADVARRCATLNPHYEELAAQKTEGILLIDEVDMHLHPRWQQLIIELLRKAFPRLQIIVSTHSPHVLSTVDKDAIRVIRLQDGLGTVETPKLQTRGVESADILSSIMGVDPVPQVKEAQELSEYRSLIEDNKSQSAEAHFLRDKVIAHFGERHPLVLDCDRLIRFQAFKLKNTQSPES